MEKEIKTKNGYVMLLTAVVFMMISFIIVFGLATPIIKQILSSRDIWGGKQAYYLSESGIEDVVYKIKGAEFSSPVVGDFITIDGGEAVISEITTDTSGNKKIKILSDNNNYKKEIEISVEKSEGVSFNYGIQTGNGGITMNGGSIIGNVYSNGDIFGCNWCKITGSAIVANSPSLFTDQENYLPESPTKSIVFGTSTNYQDLAQSFKVSSTSPVTQINLYIKKVGSPSDITLSIRSDSSGKPNPSSSLSSLTIPASLITTSYGWVEVPLSSNPNLVVGNIYWITLDASNNATNYYSIAANLDSSYLNGTVKVGKINSTWYNANYDSYFKIFLGGDFGRIYGEGEDDKFKIGTGGIGGAYAHSLSYIEATGDLKCQVGISNNKICDKTYPDPSPMTMPISDGNIEDWKTEATLGGVINGNYDVSGSNKITLGAKKIIGNLTVGGSGVLTLTGSLYVTGNITISGSGIIKLDPFFAKNSGILVTDGVVEIPGSGKATGSGQTGSYMIIVTTSSCPTGSSCSGHNAVEMSGSGGAVILNAQKGTINFSGSAKANEATANKITMSGSTEVIYESGITNPTFKDGPSGSFNISGWKELEE
jgi:hypothetical protein